MITSAVHIPSCMVPELNSKSPVNSGKVLFVKFFILYHAASVIPILSWTAAVKVTILDSSLTSTSFGEKSNDVTVGAFWSSLITSNVVFKGPFS